MTDKKKKGDFHRTSSQQGEVGGNNKAHAKPDSDSRTAHKQPNISGARNVGTDD
jgi:hypothetical protein